MSIREKILEMMREEGYEPQYKEELAIRFRQNRKSLPEFYRVLDRMVKEEVLERDAEGRYRTAERRSSLMEGVFSAHARGFGFVVPLTGEERDLHIEREFVRGAMNGDRVLAKRMERRNGMGNDEGAIVEILERRNRKIVGTYLESGSFGFVVPLNDKIAYDFYVPTEFRNGAVSKQRVVLEITAYPEGRRNPEGKIVEILGFSNEKGTDILSVVREKDIPDTFSEETMREAELLPDEVSGSELKGRTDYTDLLTFTIDGSDAKDFDDAVSCERLGNGSYLLGVHIADVSHYVKEGTAIDKDAEERGNSVYLLSKVVPMLPEKLSNGLCSLKEGVIRLTLSVMMEIDRKGKVVHSEIHPSYIRSRRRLIYDDVSDLLETGKTEDASLPELSETLEWMEELYRILNEKRRARGTIEFEFPETLIDLDENDRPTGIRRFERRVANRLIEEFMLVANETIAETYVEAEVPFLYRVHEEPDAMKMLSLSETVSNLGYSFAVRSEVEPKDLQELMDQTEETKDGRLIHMLVLRSLRKARYAEECLGHFGLAVEYYTHFTSPIRRYSDLMIHRIIKEMSEKKKLSAKRRRDLEKRLPKLAEHLSATERRAEDAEREVDAMKTAEYMANFVGETFPGIISTVTNFGIFVELENSVEGLVRYDSMDDYFIYDESRMLAVGERSGRSYRMGDEVVVKVENVSIERREVDFSMVEARDVPKRNGKRRKRRRVR